MCCKYLKLYHHNKLIAVLLNSYILLFKYFPTKLSIIITILNNFYKKINKI